MKCSATILFGALFAQNLIVNGGFDDFSSAHCSKAWCGPGSGVILPAEAIRPWFVSSVAKNFELDGSVWKAYNGNWSMDLNSDRAITISQNVNLLPGNVYQLQFQMNENYCNGNLPVKTGVVGVTGSATKKFSHSHGVNKEFGHNWKQVKYRFTATDFNSTVSIGSNSPGSCGPVVDEITLIALKQCGA